MKASVIIPTYNSEGVIKDCLDSLLSQTFDGEYEVVVVDDGSTDGTVAAVASYPVKLLTQEHVGPATARNLGAKDAEGEILLFTDADCIPESDWIEEMCAPFEDREIAGVQGRYESRQDGIVSKFAQYEIEERYEIMSNSRYIDFVGSYSAGYRRDIFLEEGGFDESFPTASGEDPDLSYRLASRGHRLLFVPEAVVYHRHPDSIGKYLKMKFYRAYWRVALYGKNPEKTVKDTYTPQLLKVQIALFYLFVASLLNYVVLLVFVLTTLPLSWQVLKKDKKIGVLTPAFVFLRTAAFGAGLVFGLAALALKRK